MNNKNEIKLINACIRKNKEIKKLKNEIEILKSENVYLIEVFQTLQKHLNFELVFDRSNNYLVSLCLSYLDIIDFEIITNAIERYGIK